MVRVLDQYALAIVTINAESRVKVEVGPAKRESEQEGTVINRPHFWLRFPNASNDDIFETTGGVIRNRPYSQRPYWRIESNRIGNTREVAVEIVVDGKPTARKNILADGQVRELDFDVPIDRSSWLAAWILPSSHTNPIFVIVSGKPSVRCEPARNGAWRTSINAGRKRLLKYRRSSWTMPARPIIMRARSTES